MKHATPEIKLLAISLYRDKNYSQAQVAEIVGYSVSAIKKWLRADERGELLLQKKRGAPPKVLSDDDRNKLKTIIQQNKHVTLEAMVEMLDHKCKITTIFRTLREMGYTYKKKRFMPTNE